MFIMNEHFERVSEMNAEKIQTVEELRVTNLQLLLQDRYDNVVLRMAKDTGISEVTLYRVISMSGDSSRKIGPKLARRIETALGLQTGALDVERGPDRQEADELNTQILSLSPAQRSQIQALIDAMTADGSSR